MSNVKDNKLVGLWRDVIAYVQGTDHRTFSSPVAYEALQDRLQSQGLLEDRYKITCHGRDVYLTLREKQVLLLMDYQVSAARIAKKLGLSIRTIEYYTANLKIKLNVTSKKSLVALAIESGLRQQLLG